MRLDEARERLREWFGRRKPPGSVPEPANGPPAAVVEAAAQAAASLVASKPDTGRGGAAPVLSSAARQQGQAIAQSGTILKTVGMLTGAGELGMLGAGWAAGNAAAGVGYQVGQALGLDEQGAQILRRTAGLAAAGAVVAGPLGAVVGGGAQLVGEGASWLIGEIAGEDTEKAVRDAVSQLDPTRPDTVPGRILAAPVQLVQTIADSLQGKLPPQPELAPEVEAREAAHRAYYEATKDERARAEETLETIRAVQAETAAPLPPAVVKQAATAAATVAQEARISARRRIE